jgi:hypothetical protein
MGLTDIFTKPIVDLSLSDLACATLLALLLWAVSLLVYGWWCGIVQAWRRSG